MTVVDPTKTPAEEGVELQNPEAMPKPAEAPEETPKVKPPEGEAPPPEKTFTEAEVNTKIQDRVQSILDGHKGTVDKMRKDMEALGQTEDTFRFFLVFAFEVIDRYGRLRCFINRDQPHRTAPEPRPRSYNERLLQAGVVSLYFIWPNINPFRRKESLRAAVISAGVAGDTADADPIA